MFYCTVISFRSQQERRNEKQCKDLAVNILGISKVPQATAVCLLLTFLILFFVHYYLCEKASAVIAENYDHRSFSVVFFQWRQNKKIPLQ